MKLLKTLLVAIIVLLAVGLLMGSLCFHNDKCYTYIHEELSPYTAKHFGCDPAETMEGVAKSLDLKGWLKRLKHGVADEDRVSISIEDDQLDKFKKYLKKSPVKKKWFKATVNINGVDLPAKLKLHGTDPVHHTGGKYSFTIKLASDSILMNGSRRFKLIKGEEADPTVIAINKLAHDMGLISTYGKMVMVELNGECTGEYYLVEDIKKEFLERHMGITNYTVLTHTSDWTRKDYMLGKGHITDLDLFGEHLEGQDDPFFTQGVAHYNRLCETILSEDISAMKSMFDLDYMARYMALASIFNDPHFMSGDNLKLVYDFSRGKFFPIYRAEFPGHAHTEGSFSSFPNMNQMLFGEDLGIYDQSITKLFILLLQDNKFRGMRDEQLISIVRNRSDFIGSISETFSENENVMLRSDLTHRMYERNKAAELDIVYKSLYFAGEYLDYNHVYGTYDSTRSALRLQVESFVPVKINLNDSITLHKSHLGVSFGKDLSTIYHPVTLKVDEEVNLKDFYLVNLVNEDTVGKHIHINHGILEDVEFEESEETEPAQPIVYKGTHVIKEDVHIDACENTVIFEAGARLKLDPGVNFSIDGTVEFNGTKGNEVVIEANSNEPYGSFVIIGCSENSTVDGKYLNVSGGSESTVNGRLFTGQFAIYNSNVSLYNCGFTGSMADDGLNIKYSKVTLDSCSFTLNMADQVDLDFCCAVVSNCVFAPSDIDDNGDGLDLSGSYASISKSSFTGFLDKGLSLGEKSRVLVTECDFKSNLAAVAIKDQTNVIAWNNSFDANQLDFTSYIKKSFFQDPFLSIDDANGVNLSLTQGAPDIVSEDTINAQKAGFEEFFNAYRGTTFIRSKIELDRAISDIATSNSN